MCEEGKEGTRWTGEEGKEGTRWTGEGVITTACDDLCTGQSEAASCNGTENCKG